MKFRRKIIKNRKVIVYETMETDGALDGKEGANAITMDSHLMSGDRNYTTVWNRDA